MAGSTSLKAKMAWGSGTDGQFRSIAMKTLQARGLFPDFH